MNITLSVSFLHNNLINEIKYYNDIYFDYLIITLNLKRKLVSFFKEEEIDGIEIVCQDNIHYQDHARDHVHRKEGETGVFQPIAAIVVGTLEV